MRKKIVLGIIGIIGLSLLSVGPVFADQAAAPTPPIAGTAIKISDITQLVTSVLSFLLIVSGLVVTGFVVYAGITIATAGDSDTKMKKGRAMLQNAVWGALVVFGVGVIVATLASFAQTPTSIIP